MKRERCTACLTRGDRSAMTQFTIDSEKRERWIISLYPSNLYQQHRVRDELAKKNVSFLCKSHFGKASIVGGYLHGDAQPFPIKEVSYYCKRLKKYLSI